MIIWERARAALLMLGFHEAHKDMRLYSLDCPPKRVVALGSDKSVDLSAHDDRTPDARPERITVRGAEHNITARVFTAVRRLVGEHDAGG